MRPHAARVAVIGSEAKTKLFSGEYAIGQNIRIDGISYQGHRRARAAHAGRRRQHQQDHLHAVQHHERLQGHALPRRHLARLTKAIEFELVERQVRGVLAQQYNFKPDDKRAVFVFNMMKQLKQFQIITMGLKILLGFIGTLTLGIGGVGLMNIMLVSVTQRTREIGVEKGSGRTAQRHPLPVSRRSAGDYRSSAELPESRWLMRFRSPLGG